MTTEEIRISADAGIELLNSLQLAKWIALKTLSFENDDMETCIWIKENVAMSGLQIISSCGDMATPASDAENANDFLLRVLKGASSSMDRSTMDSISSTETVDTTSSVNEDYEIISSVETTSVVDDSEESAVDSITHDATTSVNDKQVVVSDKYVSRLYESYLTVTIETPESTQLTETIETPDSAELTVSIETPESNGQIEQSEEPEMSFLNASESVTVGQNRTAEKKFDFNVTLSREQLVLYISIPIGIMSIMSVGICLRYRFKSLRKLSCDFKFHRGATHREYKFKESPPDSLNSSDMEEAFFVTVPSHGSKYIKR